MDYYFERVYILFGDPKFRWDYDYNKLTRTINQLYALGLDMRFGNLTRIKQLIDKRKLSKKEFYELKDLFQKEYQSSGKTNKKFDYLLKYFLKNLDKFEQYSKDVIKMSRRHTDIYDMLPVYNSAYFLG